MSEESYQLIALEYQAKSCGCYQARVLIELASGCQKLGFGESNKDIYSAVLAAIDQVLGPEQVAKWVFGSFNFQTVPLRNRSNGQGLIKCRVDIHYPQGDGFSGICQENDVNLAVAKAYLQAINRLLIGRKDRPEPEVVVVV